MTNLPRLTSPRFLAIDPRTGRPVANGWVGVYVAGTTTLATVYNDRGATSAATNPARLDAAGGADLYISGPVRIVVQDANLAEIYTVDNWNSTEVEIGEDAPEGALLAANNLSDLSNVATARAALGLVKQSAATDVTAGSVLLNGAHGLGGNAPPLEPPDTLTGISVSGWRYVAAVNLVAVGGPTDAGVVDCIVETMIVSPTMRYQNLFPLSAQNWTPFRRMYYVSGYSDWLRDTSREFTATGGWLRLANGWQECWYTGAEMTTTDAVGNIFRSGTETFTFQKPFIATPIVTFGCVRVTDGVAVPWATGSPSAPSSDNLNLTQVKGTLYGPTNTAAGKIMYRAAGRWR